MENGIPAVAKLPIDPELTKAADAGRIEELENNPLSDFLTKITKKLK